MTRKGKIIGNLLLNRRFVDSISGGNDTDNDPASLKAITPELLEIHDAWNIPLSERRALLQNASISPDVLLGWQVL